MHPYRTGLGTMLFYGFTLFAQATLEEKIGASRSCNTREDCRAAETELYKGLEQVRKAPQKFDEHSIRDLITELSTHYFRKVSRQLHEKINDPESLLNLGHEIMNTDFYSVPGKQGDLQAETVTAVLAARNVYLHCIMMITIQTEDPVVQHLQNAVRKRISEKVPEVELYPIVQTALKKIFFPKAEYAEIVTKNCMEFQDMYAKPKKIPREQAKRMFMEFYNAVVPTVKNASMPGARSALYRLDLTRLYIETYEKLSDAPSTGHR